MAKQDFILMDALTNPAVRFISVGGKVWDNVAKELVDSGTYADTAIVLAEDDFINGIPVKFPAEMPSGDYHMVFYDAAAPAKTDAYSRWFAIGWIQQGGEITYCKDLAPMA